MWHRQYFDDRLNALKEQATTPQQYCTASIAIIDALTDNIGYCSKMVGLDEFDRKITKGQNNLISVEFEGANIFNLSRPYTDVSLKPQNKWLMNCAQLNFRTKHNIIPTNTYSDCLFQCSHTLPLIVNIQRSNGKIQKGRLRNNTGITIRPNKDFKNEMLMYVRVEFDNITDDETTIPTYQEKMQLDYFKDVLIYDFLELNPEIKSFDLKFTMPNFLNEKINSHKYLVMKYYSELHSKWCSDVLRPVIDNIEMDELIPKILIDELITNKNGDLTPYEARELIESKHKYNVKINIIEQC